MFMIPKKNHDLWEDIFDDPFFRESTLRRREESHIMKTDIKELKDKFEITVDLPGYEKENLDMSIEDGYLTVHAKTTKETNEGEEDGKFVRKERFYGECSRSFYVGEDITEEDIKASFKNGTLKIEVPKKEEKKALPEKKFITIE